jgi:hypothetical protein
MSQQTCDRCSIPVYRKVYETDPETKKIVGIGVDCGCRRIVAMQRSTKSVFDITLDHVKDSWGNKVHVSNLRELSAAEKTYGFQSVVLNSDAQNFDDPPQQRRIEVGDLYKRKFSRGGR